MPDRTRAVEEPRGPGRHRGGRAGFMMVELLVAMVLLTVVAISLVGASQYVSTTVRRSGMEMRAGSLLQGEIERLLTLPYDSLSTGSRNLPYGVATWTEADSVSFKEILLITEFRSGTGVVLWDTISAYRLRL